MMPYPIVETVDVSDICRDIDEVVIMKERHQRYRASPFVEDSDGHMTEIDVDIREYPAVVTVCRRSLDLPGSVTFDPLPVYEPDEPI